MSVQDVLKNLPSVDEVLRGAAAAAWLAAHPRALVVDAVRRVIELKRMLVISGRITEIAEGEAFHPEIENELKRLAEPNLKPLINATGIVMHTNLGRSPLTERAVEHIAAVARGYSNLEYDIKTGKRGKRYAHVRELIARITGAEDALVVNNNAGAVLLCLSALARGREVIVSRGELVEIGGSFRVPEVMEQSGAILREVGATNKTHARDYEGAVSEATALLLKVHQSNFRIKGFTSEVSVEELVRIGRAKDLPVMYDMGSGCLVDLKPHGIHSEHTVQEVVKAGPDVVTFSGDKLLGGPQAGVIVGSYRMIEAISKHPLVRALRIDKLTLAALEATLREYVDLESAKQTIPTLRMLLAGPEEVKARARRIAALVRKAAPMVTVTVRPDVTFSGGGALPTDEFPTWVVALDPAGMGEGALEERLRKGEPPVVCRITEGVCVLDARTVADAEVKALAECVGRAVGPEA
jgi:L-seryl-tRNA(Ser) seleniumtransferase